MPGWKAFQWAGRILTSTTDGTVRYGWAHSSGLNSVHWCALCACCNKEWQEIECPSIGCIPRSPRGGRMSDRLIASEKHSRIGRRVAPTDRFGYVT